MRKYVKIMKKGDLSMMRSKNGFTLAEVLVTLGIIGVVSAMTVPTLMQNYQRDSYTTQLHKVYNEVSQAMLRVITESNAVSLRESNFSKNGAGWFLRTYFKTVKTCEYADLSSCFANDYQNMGGSSITLSNTVPNASSCAVIASGASICMTTNVVVVDINGKQGPNILGRDLFSFGIANDGTVDTSDAKTKADSFSTKCSSATSDYEGYCFAKILNDGWKMDY